MLGLIGKKLDMTQIFDANGRIIPVTAIQIDPNVVVGLRTPEKNGYSAVILGAGTKRKIRVRKPYAGQFPAGVEPTQELKEFKDFERESQVGERLGVELFDSVPFVDVHAVSKGKGFQGVVKRHGFRGGRMTHGSKFHREGASIGNAGMKPFKGTQMAGRMGGEQTTVQNLRLIRVDKEKGLLLVRGAVPGPRGAMVVVSRARKK